MMNYREKAEKIFDWAKEQRHDELSDGWKIHSLAAAKVAKTIAKKVGMDASSAA